MAMLLRLMALIVGALVAACGGGTDTPAVRTMAGAMQASPLTCGYEHVYVTVEKVRVYTGAADAEDGAFELTVAPAARIDLAHLSGGVLHELNVALLPSGHYTGMRLFLASNDATAGALANAVKPADSPLVPLATPGAASSGLKVQFDFDVPAGDTADVILQFDACQSVSAAGNSGRYILQPVLAGTGQLENTVPILGERRVSTVPGELNAFPAIGGLPGGGFVIAWYFLSTDQGTSAIRMRRFDAAGATVGAEEAVSTSRAGQSPPRIAVLKDGGYVVAWAAIDYTSLLVQRFDASGARVGGETRVNVMPLEWRASAFGIAALADGGFALTWASPDGGVYLRRFDAAGTPATEVRVNPVGDVAWRVAYLAGLPDGGHVVIWTRQRQDGSGLNDVYARRFDASGTAVAAPTQVNTTTGPSLYATAITTLADGGWVIAWNVENQPFDLPTGTGTDVYAQRFDAAGNPSGLETRVNTTTLWNQEMAEVGALSGGGYVIAWESITQGLSGWDIDSQRFAAGGARVGGERLVNTTTAGNEQRAAVAGLADGGYVVAWGSLVADHDLSGIYMQRFAADDTPL